MHTRTLTWIPIVMALAPLGCDKVNEFVPPPPPTVTVANPISQDVTRYLELPGRLQAVEAVDIRARVRGYLESMEFEPGTLVQQGDLLFTLEREEYEAALASAQGKLDQSKAALSLMENTLERVKNAAAQQAASDLEVLEAEANRDAASGAVVEAQAAVDAATLNLSYTEIHSPVAGRVDRELVEVGNLVGANEPTLLTTVLSEDPIHVFFNLNERDLLRILGQKGRDENRRATTPVYLTLANGEPYDREGRIDFASNTIDPTTGTIEIRAIFDNPDAVLFPGLFVRIRIPERTGEALVVPKEIVLRDVAGPYVLVVNDQNVVERRGVTLGPVVAEGRVIDGGLEATDHVIVNGFQRARPGAPVSPEHEKETTPNPAPATNSGQPDSTDSNGGEG